MNLSSSWFEDGGFIPPAAAGPELGENVSPPLRWSESPPETFELALLIEDPDAPRTRPAVHLIAYGISPEVDCVSEGELSCDGFAHFGVNSFGHVGYTGPLPLRGHGKHTYHLQILALGRPLSFESPPTLDVFLAASRGAVLARGCLRGCFEV